jgi:predicted NBD/HSP70 family sugar kinase
MLTDPGARAGGAERRRNLALVLQRVHAAPATRSELTRVSGLNRSTVGALVADLAGRGLVVEEGAAAVGQVGRPSPVVRAGDSPVAVAINPEVDAITVALVALGGRVVAIERTPFTAAPTVEETVDAGAASVQRLLADHPTRNPVGAGLAVPGVVSTADGVVRLAPHLGWRDVPLAQRFGGASGIGGGIVANGVPLAGATGHAGEFGHTILASSESADTLGVRGTLESAVSRAALLELLHLDDTAPDRFEAALIASDDPAVAREVERQIDVLATAIANAVTVLNPARVILGGFLSALAAVSAQRLDTLVADRALPGIGERVEIRRSELGASIMLIGAAELAFGPLLADPSAYTPS